MSSPWTRVLSCIAGVSLGSAAFGQSIANPQIEQSRILPNVTADGTALPPSSVLPRSAEANPTNAGVNADGMGLPGMESADSTDGSFGDQQILKSQPKQYAFTLNSDASIFYTSNAALTRAATISDSFLVVNAALSWDHALSRELAFQGGVRTSIFRYNDTTPLDFEAFGAGVGLLWAPGWAHNFVIAARFDFTELLDTHSREILRDHQFLLGIQRVFPLGRAHAFSAGLSGSAGLTDPYASQRETLGLTLAYHVQLARKLDADLSYRIGGLFYNKGGRTDLNQFLNLSLNYRLAPFASISGFWSVGKNSSNESVFDYEVFTAGGGLSLTVKF